MTDFLSPGVFPSEVDFSAFVRAKASSVLGLVGVFEKGPVGAATLVTSLAEAQRVFGTYVTGHYGMHALRNFFENGGERAQVVRTLHYTAGVGQGSTSTFTLQDRAGVPLDTLQVDAINEGVWGDGISVETKASEAYPTTGFNLEVSLNSVVVEKFKDMLIGTVNAASADYVERKINDVSTHITVSDLASVSPAPTELPAIGTEALASGDDGLTGLVAADYVGDSAYGNGLYALENVPLNVMAVPGESDDQTVGDGIITVCEARKDCFGLIDGPDTATLATITTYRDNFDSAKAAVVVGWVNDVNPVDNQAIALPPSGIVAGIIARSDEAVGPWAAPAGLNRGIVFGVTGVRTEFAKASRDTLYEKNVNPLALIGGTLVFWGNRTLQKKTTLRSSINVERLMLHIETSVEDATTAFVFELNDKQTREAVKRAISPFLQRLKDKRGLRDFAVVSDTSNNPKVDVDAGILRVQVLVKPPTAAEFIPLEFAIASSGADLTV